MHSVVKLRDIVHLDVLAQLVVPNGVGDIVGRARFAIKGISASLTASSTLEYFGALIFKLGTCFPQAVIPTLGNALFCL